MIDVAESVKKLAGYDLHIIPSKKFKTVNIVVKFKAPLNRETITKRAFLPYLLMQGTKNYPSERELQLKLENLYGATLSIDGAKKGNYHTISIRLEVANQKYINNESSILDEALSLLKEVIFEPNSTDQAFIPEVFNREKETLKQAIRSIVDDKVSYANMRLIDNMCEGESYELHLSGYEEDLSELTAEDTFSYYQSLLKEDEIDVYILGDIDTNEVEKQFSSLISFNNPNQVANVTAEKEQTNRSEVQEIIEVQDIQQAKLHIGYRTNCTFQDQEYFALQVFNGLFGAFPSSKLFVNVREKNSLAYYASSRIESHKGLLFVFSGIAAADYKKAREIIELQMDEMRKGNFTEDQLKETKDLIINQLLSTMDHPQGIIELLYQQVVANKQLSPNELIDNIRKVMKEEVVEVANKIKEDTIFLLTSEEGKKDE